MVPYIAMHSLSVSLALSLDFGFYLIRQLLKSWSRFSSLRCCGLMGGMSCPGEQGSWGALFVRGYGSVVWAGRMAGLANCIGAWLGGCGRWVMSLCVSSVLVSGSALEARGNGWVDWCARAGWYYGALGQDRERDEHV